MHTNIVKTMHPYEIKVLQNLDKEITVRELAKQASLQEIQVKRAVQWLSNKSLVTFKEINDKKVVLGENGKLYKDKGLPEVRFLKSLKDDFEFVEKIKKTSNLSNEEVNLALGNLKRKNAIDIKKEDKLKVKITGEGKKLLSKQSPEELFLKKLPVAFDDLNDLEKNTYKDLLKRKNIISVEDHKDTVVSITGDGLKIKKVVKNYDSSKITDKLTVDMLKSKAWKNKEFRHYDVRASVPKIYGGRKHPLTAIIGLIRDIFVEMGFQEMKGPLVETAFWCMDSMWIPQDHPARETQDTFYLPIQGDLPDRELVKKVKEAHESGGNTGSKGYMVEWNPVVAKQLLLRTHTTATTFRILHEHEISKKDNAKYFYIGRIYRNEAIDATHLPEFHQVEGFVMDDGLNVQDLMGFIKEFYSKMGIHKIKFKLTYNPYTEPSLEALYYNEKRKSWLELINSGVFRPESLYPYGITKPIIAWGLGVERLAMVLYELDKLKDLVGSGCDLNWLKSYVKQIRKE